VAAPTHEDRRHAEDTLSYIRDTMHSATTSTAVSGWGLIAVGVTGLVASWIDLQVPATAPMRVWIPAAIVGLTVSAIGNGAKARKLGVPLWTGSFRKMVWGLTPALIVGTFLTLALAEDVRVLIPGMWLGVYGAGVTAAGAFSVRAFRALGVMMIALGGLALWRPDLGLLLLAIGFGFVHAAVGVFIVARHGG
jgi:hypothetical protein